MIIATSRPLYPRERPSTRCIEGWVGPPRASVNGRGKYGPPPGFDPRIVQPVASGYTDLAIPAHRNAVYEVYILMLRSSVWVEASRTSRKLAGLIPGGVMGIFH